MKKITLNVSEEQLEKINKIKTSNNLKDRTETFHYLIEKYQNEDKDKLKMYEAINSETDFILKNIVGSLDQIKDVLRIMNDENANNNLENYLNEDI